MGALCLDIEPTATPAPVMAARRLPGTWSGTWSGAVAAARARVAAAVIPRLRGVVARVAAAAAAAVAVPVPPTGGGVQGQVSSVRHRGTAPAAVAAQRGGCAVVVMTVGEGRRTVPVLGRVRAPVHSSTAHYRVLFVVGVPVHRGYRCMDSGAPQSDECASPT